MIYRDEESANFQTVKCPRDINVCRFVGYEGEFDQMPQRTLP